MTTVPGNSIVAVLSTSVVLLPASTPNNSVPATSKSNGENVAGGISNDDGVEETPRDIFVAYELMKTNLSILSSPVALNNTDHCSGSPAGATLGHHDHGIPGTAGTEGARYDTHHRARQKNTPPCNQKKGLLVTASPSRLTTSRQQHYGDDDGATSSDESVTENEIAETWRRSESTGSSDSPPVPREPPAVRLSNVAPLPLLVFDTETFLALGELDERFAFQGGVAEWISRAKLDGRNQRSTNIGIDDGYCCPAPFSRCDGSPEIESAARDHETVQGPSCSADPVQHVHEQEWSRQFVGLWSDDAASTDETVDSGDATANHSNFPDNGSPRVDPLVNFGQQQDQAGERVLLGEGGDGHGYNYPKDQDEGQRTNEEAPFNERQRLPEAKLEALVQADADLFFLPLLLLQQSPGERAHALLLCVVFFRASDSHTHLSSVNDISKQYDI